MRYPLRRRPARVATVLSVAVGLGLGPVLWDWAARPAWASTAPARIDEQKAPSDAVRGCGAATGVAAPGRSGQLALRR